MKKFFVTMFAAFAMFAMVSCGNAAISAGEAFIENPTIENYKAMKEAYDKLDADGRKEAEEWMNQNDAKFENAVKNDPDLALEILELDPSFYEIVIFLAEEFVENPSEETLKAVDEAEKILDEDGKKEFDKWCEDHAKELAAALLKGMAKELAE